MLQMKRAVQDAMYMCKIQYVQCAKVTENNVCTQDLHKCVLMEHMR